LSQYKRYLAYKDSGVGWLGRVPEHWQVRSTKALACLDGGSGFPDEEQGQSGNPIPFFKVADLVTSLRYAPNTVTEETARRLGAKIFPANTLVFAKVGAALFLNRRCLLKMPACLDNNMMALLPVSCDARWLFWVFSAINMGVVANPGAVPSINQEQVGNIKLGVPSDLEQRNIARGLDRETARIDALIEKKTRFIELLREKRQALITHAVTKGLDPKVRMKDSGVEWLGSVPEHWSVKRLKFIATVQTGIAKGKDNAEKDTVEVPYLRVANVQDGYLDLEEVATIEVSTADLPRYLLQPGDVLMNEGGDFDKLGRGHVWHGEIGQCIHQNHVFAVRPHGVSSEWLNTFTSSTAAQFYFMGRSKQSTNLASISSSNLMELAVPLPCEEEQRLILDELDRQTAKISALGAKTESSIALLKERRSALITAAVTGQIDLRESA